MILLACLLAWGSPQGVQVKPIVCIDPGHPSENGVGTRGRRVTEVRAAWQVAGELKRLLAAKHVQVVMTKSREKERVTNLRRAEIANRAKANLFVRLHCDSANASGFGVYYPDRTAKLGKDEGPAQEILAASRIAAAALQPSMAHELAGKLKDRGLMTDRQTAIGGRQGALTGSIYAKVPVVLIEMAVLTNRRDEAFMSSAANRRLLAKAICSGVESAIAALKKAEPPPHDDDSEPQR